ncbi:hypothetical protein [Burkholderia cenocepacia]|uniref:hypothetical protein n=1 Tax=Burkholderia cenocepacia TaxID=95486 RepID=UPI0013E0E3AD|nr:hypothetical protein [Burkholderia cenocepacia]MCW3587417.1 hypothetical protein [Burkholderia cenocepacia]MCW3633887.1 hypothetical protein [Burkholderia cenocepacia]MCW5184789.1 hypothetical protein [Burkholderia cenocepacia]
MDHTDVSWPAVGAKVGTVVSLEQARIFKEQLMERINLLSSEIDANEEENRAMQAEIDSLYARIDAEEANGRLNDR